MSFWDSCEKQLCTVIFCVYVKIFLRLILEILSGADPDPTRPKFTILGPYSILSLYVSIFGFSLSFTNSWDTQT